MCSFICRMLSIGRVLEVVPSVLIICRVCCLYELHFLYFTQLLASASVASHGSHCQLFHWFPQAFSSVVCGSFWSYHICDLFRCSVWGHPCIPLPFRCVNVLSLNWVNIHVHPIRTVGPSFPVGAVCAYSSLISHAPPRPRYSSAALRPAAHKVERLTAMGENDCDGKRKKKADKNKNKFYLSVKATFQFERPYCLSWARMYPFCPVQRNCRFGKW